MLHLFDLTDPDFFNEFDFVLNDLHPYTQYVLMLHGLLIMPIIIDSMVHSSSYIIKWDNSKWPNYCRYNHVSTRIINP